MCLINTMGPWDFSVCACFGAARVQLASAHHLRMMDRSGLHAGIFLGAAMINQNNYIYI